MRVRGVEAPRESPSGDGARPGSPVAVAPLDVSALLVPTVAAALSPQARGAELEAPGESGPSGDGARPGSPVAVAPLDVSLSAPPSPPSLFVLAAAAALARAKTGEDSAYRETLDEVLLQNRCNSRGAELESWMTPTPVAVAVKVDSPPPIARRRERPPLTRQNGFRHKSTTRGLPPVASRPPDPAPPPSPLVDSLPAAERRRTLPPRTWLGLFRRSRG